MNYRHAFHAGNFADVMKHAILARIVVHLKKKDTAYRAIDTHAGAGLYDLTGAEAARGGEWQDGIARLLSADLQPALSSLLAPYVDAVRTHNSSGKISNYPGSPLLLRGWLRPQDRLIATESEPKAATALKRNLGRDVRVKAIEIDGWTALDAYIPPKERRGLVLIDPPFEVADEWGQLTARLIAARAKWPTGMFLAWYPIKEPSAGAAFARKLASSGAPSWLRAEITIPAPAGRLQGSGLMIVNPPWTLDSELRTLLPGLAEILGGTQKGRFLLDGRTGEAR